MCEVHKPLNVAKDTGTADARCTATSLMKCMDKKLASTLSDALLALSEQDTSIMRIDAEPFLNRLRKLVNFDSSNSNYFSVDLTKRSNSADQKMDNNLSKAYAAISQTFRLTSVGFPEKLIFTRRPWANSSNFHIDTSALTIILPIEDASTPYLIERFVSANLDISHDYDLPLDTVPHTMSKCPNIAHTGKNEIVLLKGAGWSGANFAAVHSSPYKLHGSSKTTQIALAFILEFQNVR